MYSRLSIVPGIVLLALLLGLGYAENPLTEPPTSPHPAEQDTVPISGAQTSRLPELNSATSISYPLGEGVEVCLVSPPDLAVLLQADQSAGLVGEFLVQRFDETLFRLSHLVWACQSPGTSATPVEGDCAQVWIEVLGEVSERGSFWVTFRPAGGGPAIHTLFSYGPRHITYRGPIPDSGPVFIPATTEGIIFELRDSEFTLAEETVCESLDGVSYQQSTLLGSRGKFDMQCAEAISSVAGGYSRPYVMNIHLDNVSTASQLSLRQISVSFSPTCALTQVPSSAPLNVTGVSMEVTTDTTTTMESTTPGEGEGTTTALGPSTAHSTREPTTTISTTLAPSSSPNSNTGLIVTVALLVTAVVVAVIVLAVVLCWYTRCKRKKPTAVAEKKPNMDVEKKLGEVVEVSSSSNTTEDSGVVVNISDRWLPSVESKTGWLPSPTAYTAESHQTPGAATPSTGQSVRRIHRISPSGQNEVFFVYEDTPRSQRGGSGYSQTDSEGSDTHLLKELVNDVKDVKSLATHVSQQNQSLTAHISQQNQSLAQHVTQELSHQTEQISQQTGHISQQNEHISRQISHNHEEISEAVDYVSRRTDQNNLDR